MKKRTFGLGKFVYTEWLNPVFHYYATLRLNEAMFEIIIPVVISIVCTVSYAYLGIADKALKALANLLPTAISILIGFTIMLVTLLVTSDGNNIKKLKEKSLKKQLYGKQVTLYQGLLIQFSHSLVSEIVLLFVLFFYLYLRGLKTNGRIELVFLAVEIHLTLNILLTILRGTTNLYFSFYSSGLYADHKQNTEKSE